MRHNYVRSLMAGVFDALTGRVREVQTVRGQRVPVGVRNVALPPEVVADDGEMLRWIIDGKQVSCPRLRWRGKPFSDAYALLLYVPHPASGRFSRFESNVIRFTGIVEWGDGTAEELEDVSAPRHEYGTGGFRVVVFRGHCTALQFSTYCSSEAAYVCDILHIGSELGVRSMDGAFRRCCNLRSLQNGVFDGLGEVTSFAQVFKECTGLESLPVGLFMKCRSAVSFRESFSGCTQLVSLPTFLLPLRIGLVELDWMFMGCSRLSVLPFDLFLYVIHPSLTGVFADCFGLQSVPQRLFRHASQTTDFFHVFSGCMGLRSLPRGLFDTCVRVRTFESAFEGCFGLQELPEDLFAGCPEVQSFASAFKLCSGLRSLPHSLFDTNTQVGDFSGTFDGCTSLTGESPYSWLTGADGTKVKVHLYERSAHPDIFAGPVSTDSCFLRVSGLDDAADLPAAWGGQNDRAEQ